MKPYTVEAILKISVPNIMATSREDAELAFSKISQFDLAAIWGHEVEVLEVKPMDEGKLGAAEIAGMVP